MATDVLGSAERRHFDRRPVHLLATVIDIIETGNIIKLKASFSVPDVKKCLERALRETSQPHARSPLVLAARRNKEQIVKYLLKEFKNCINLEQESVVNIDMSNIEGATALWTSATLGHLPIVKLLVKAGADVDHGTRSKSTPIRGAAFDGHLDVVRYLTDQGANIHTANHCGQSPLGIAAAMKKIDCTKYLLSKGAHINEMGPNNDTPLHIAVESGDMEVCKLLVKAGAQNLPNSLGHTPCMLASCHGHDKVAEYLMKKFAVDAVECYDCYLLLGARKSMMIGDQSFLYWTKALEIKMAAGGKIPNHPTPHPVYGGVREPSTLTELSQLTLDQEQCLALCAVIFERVLGAAHPSTAFTMRGFGDLLIEYEKFEDCEAVWVRSMEYDKAARVAFELQVVEDLLFAVKGFDCMSSNRYLPRLQPFFVWGLSELDMARESKTSELEISCALCKVLAVWIKVINQLQEEGRAAKDKKGQAGRMVKSNGQVVVRTSVDKEQAVKAEKEEKEQTAVTTTSQKVQLLRSDGAEEERQQWRESVRLLIRATQSCKTQCLPLLACLANFSKSEPIHSVIYDLDLPLDLVLQELLDQGCSVMEHDQDRTFPLHAAVVMKTQSSAERCVDALVAAGAPLFVSDYLGRTALDLARGLNISPPNLDRLDQLYRNGFTLQSLTAVAVVAQRINYKDFPLPPHIVSYLSWH